MHKNHQTKKKPSNIVRHMYYKRTYYIFLLVLHEFLLFCTYHKKAKNGKEKYIARLYDKNNRISLGSTLFETKIITHTQIHNPLKCLRNFCRKIQALASWLWQNFSLKIWTLFRGRNIGVVEGKLFRFHLHILRLFASVKICLVIVVHKYIQTFDICEKLRRPLAPGLEFKYKKVFPYLA